MTRSGNPSNFAPMARAWLGRVRDLFGDTANTWKLIATERVTIGWIYQHHLLPLAVLALVMGLAGWGLAAAAGPAGYVFDLAMALGMGLVMLAVLMLGVWVLAQVVDALAPRFGARQSELRAFKLMAYGVTPVFLMGLFALVPGAVWVCLLGLVGSLWLIWQGLPRLMRCPPDRFRAYFAVVALALLLWAALLVTLINAMQPRGLLTPSADTTWDRAPPAARPASLPASLPAAEPASSAASAAADAAQPAASPASAVPPASEGLGLPPLAPSASAAPPADAPASAPPLSAAGLQRLTERLSAWMPTTFAGMPRDRLDVQPLTTADGPGVALNAGFGQGERAIALNVVYIGPHPRQSVLGEWANITMQREDAERFERIHAEGGRPVSEVGRKDGSGASMRVLLANGVMLDMDALGITLEQLKAAVSQLKLAELEQIRPGT